MSSITVALLGHNGLVGSKILQQLVPLQESGKVKIVVVHRPSSSTSTIPSNVEARVLDWSAQDGESFDGAFAGAHVVISAVASTAMRDQLSILPALSRSKTLQTFFTSDFGAAWSKEELDEMSVEFVKDKDAVLEKAKELSVATTQIKNGLISDFIFPFPIQWNAKENKVFVYRQSQETVIPFATSSYLAAAIITLIQRPLESLKNKEYYAIEYQHTGKEVSDIIAKLHGSAITPIPLDDEAVKAGSLDTNPYVSLGSAILNKSGRGWWSFEGQEEVKVEGWQSKGVEHELKQVISP